MEHLATKNREAMITMLKSIDKNYCQCPFGAAGKEVGYSCPGTCLDYVYDELGVEYSFAFEIFTWKQDWGDLQSRFNEKMSSPSDFIQMRSHDNHRFGDDPQECFARFNPTTRADYEETVNTWTNAYLDLANMIYSDMQAKKGAGAAQPNPKLAENEKASTEVKVEGEKKSAGLFEFDNELKSNPYKNWLSSDDDDDKLLKAIA